MTTPLQRRIARLAADGTSPIDLTTPDPSPRALADADFAPRTPPQHAHPGDAEPGGARRGLRWLREELIPQVLISGTPARSFLILLVIIASGIAAWTLLGPDADEALTPPTRPGGDPVAAAAPNHHAHDGSGTPAGSDLAAGPANPEGTPASGDLPLTPPGPIIVSVQGAVAHPGLRTVPADQRIGHVVAEAVPLPDADLAAVNLAAPVSDGMQIVITRIGDTPVPPSSEPGAVTAAPPAAGTHAGAPGTGALPASASPGGNPAPAADGAGPININTADATALQTVPGIGPATARAIVDYRTAHGPFASVDDLDAVRGIGPAKLADMRPRLTV